MGAEFNWWLLIVGIVGGGALTWLVLADLARRDREVADDEVEAEAAWIARTLDTPRLDPELAEEVLQAHRRYLGFPPPDVLVTPDELPALESEGISVRPPADPEAMPAPVAMADDADDADEAEDAAAPGR